MQEDKERAGIGRYGCGLSDWRQGKWRGEVEPIQTIGVTQLFFFQDSAQFGGALSR